MLVHSFHAKDSWATSNVGGLNHGQGHRWSGRGLQCAVSTRRSSYLDLCDYFWSSLQNIPRTQHKLSGQSITSHFLRLYLCMYLYLCPLPFALSWTWTRFTDYGNPFVLKCQFAAMILALHGRNITRAFWIIGLGGVGQSLNSCLLANLFLEEHDFVDMNKMLDTRRVADASGHPRQQGCTSSVPELGNISPHVVSDPRQRRRSMSSVAVFSQDCKLMCVLLFF